MSSEMSQLPDGESSMEKGIDIKKEIIHKGLLYVLAKRLENDFDDAKKFQDANESEEEIIVALTRCWQFKNHPHAGSGTGLEGLIAMRLGLDALPNDFEGVQELIGQLDIGKFDAQLS